MGHARFRNANGGSYDKGQGVKKSDGDGSEWRSIHQPNDKMPNGATVHNSANKLSDVVDWATEIDED